MSSVKTPRGFPASLALTILVIDRLQTLWLEQNTDLTTTLKKNFDVILT